MRLPQRAMVMVIVEVRGRRGKEMTQERKEAGNAPGKARLPAEAII